MNARKRRLQRQRRGDRRISERLRSKENGYHVSGRIFSPDIVVEHRLEATALNSDRAARLFSKLIRNIQRWRQIPSAELVIHCRAMP